MLKLFTFSTYSKETNRKNWQPADIHAHKETQTQTRTRAIVHGIAIKRMNILKKTRPHGGNTKHCMLEQIMLSTEKIKIFLHSKIVCNGKISAKRKHIQTEESIQFLCCLFGKLLLLLLLPLNVEVGSTNGLLCMFFLRQNLNGISTTSNAQTKIHNALFQ